MAIRSLRPARLHVCTSARVRIHTIPSCPKILTEASDCKQTARHVGSLIKQSLQEFAALDPSQRVSVVYIPLGATQVGVAPLLRELLYLAQIIKVARPPLLPKDTTSESQRTRAQTITEQILASNKDTFAAGVLMPLDSSELSVTTDSLFLEALGIVMSYYADASRRPCVLSFSWTAKKFTHPTYFEAATYGIKFAAAGNQKKTLPGLNFLHAELEYASRAATSQDFVVVMNFTGTPSTCPSNLYDDTGLDVASVAYPGEVTALYCGTSFSTPRAAWLAAARDASIGKTLGLPVNKTGKLAWLPARDRTQGQGDCRHRRPALAAAAKDPDLRGGRLRLLRLPQQGLGGTGRACRPARRGREENCRSRSTIGRRSCIQPIPAGHRVRRNRQFTGRIPRRVPRGVLGRTQAHQGAWSRTAIAPCGRRWLSRLTIHPAACAHEAHFLSRSSFSKRSTRNSVKTLIFAGWCRRP